MKIRNSFAIFMPFQSYRCFRCLWGRIFVNVEPSALQRETLLAFPEDEENLFPHYTLSVGDWAIVRRHRGDHNRVGLLCSFVTRAKKPGQSCATRKTQLRELGIAASRMLDGKTTPCLRFQLVR
jgi:hypothetical protein